MLLEKMDRYTQKKEGEKLDHPAQGIRLWGLTFKRNFI